MQIDLIADHIALVDAWLDQVLQQAQSSAIVYHGDCDGVISAVLFDHMLRKESADVAIHLIPVRTEQYDFAHVLAKVHALRPDVTIFLDLSIQNHPDKLQQIADDTTSAVLVYDHHSEYNSHVPANTLYLNPSVAPNGYAAYSPPPCLFAARLAQKRTGRDFDWAACIGLIAESATEEFFPLFQKISGQFPKLCRGRAIQVYSDIYDSRIKDITYAIGSAFWAPPGKFEHLAFDVLSRMVTQHSPEMFFDRADTDARELRNLEKTVHAEINRLCLEAGFNSYYAPKAFLRYAEIDSEYRIGGVVASRLVHRYKKDIVVTGQKYTGRYVVEARCSLRRNVNVASLLKEAAKDLHPYSVGGHPAAAGATLPLESSPEFFLALESAATGMID